MLRNVGAPPGEKRFEVQMLLGLGADIPPNDVPPGLLDLRTWGVISIGSSLSSGSMGSSSELLLEDSEPSMLQLPTELEAAVLSPLPAAAHAEVACMFGESITSDMERRFRDGIIMPFWVIVGDESGEDCSARVE
jgi:hypothetical protein